MVELWIGESRRPIIKEHDMVMDSVANYYNLQNPQVSYNYRRLFLDSGAFTFARSKKCVDKERIKRVQEIIDPDKAVPLDYPFLPGTSPKQMKILWEETAMNILEWQETTRLREIAPVLHAWNASSLIKNILWLAKHVDCEHVLIGTIVTPSFSTYTGFFGDRQVSVKNILLILRTIQLLKHYTDFKVHLTGFGSSPMTLHLAYLMGADSVDSAGYRRKAAYGKILLPGRGERYVGRGDATFGVKPLTAEDMKLLAECQCPVCRSSHEELWKDWKARAIHNKYVLELEARKAKEKLKEGIDSYQKYLDDLYKSSSTILAKCYKVIKKQLNQLPLHFWMY